MHEGSRAISKAREPAGPEGVGRASGETRARGQRAPFLAACGLQASAAARSALVLQQPPLQRHPVRNNASSYQPFAMYSTPVRDSITLLGLQTHDARTHFVFLFISSLDRQNTAKHPNTANSVTGSTLPTRTSILKGEI